MAIAKTTLEKQQKTANTAKTANEKVQPTKNQEPKGDQITKQQAKTQKNIVNY